jgi:hypothetical protein
MLLRFSTALSALVCRIPRSAFLLSLSHTRKTVSLSMFMLQLMRLEEALNMVCL